MKPTLNRYVTLAAGLFILSGAISSCKKETVTNPVTKMSMVKTGQEKAQMTTITYKSVNILYGIFTGNLDSYKTESANSILSCAVVVHDTTEIPYKVSADFGSGCTLEDGSVVTGKITATYNNKKFTEPGSHATANLDSFYVNGDKIVGTVDIINNGMNGNNNLVFGIVITGGKLVYGSDGRFIKQDVHWELEFMRNDPETSDDDVLSVTGNSNGVTSDNFAYNEAITIPLTASRHPLCVREFVKGTTLIQISGQSDITLDYGDGTCDEFATVTQEGISETITLKKY
ncbi:MAG: hypothetical protein KIS94_01260 [Chitinophagales bacterium]|nr:hypothetical protein [Chitinophagales bacterium]